MFQRSALGFTLIELLVVISIISLVSSIALSALSTARTRARDAKRQADMVQILNAVNLFYDQYGCLPTPGSTLCSGFTAETNAGTWDYSSQGASFMSFLVAAGFLKVSPADPLNNMTGDNSPAGTFAYRYYCYPAGAPAPDGFHLGYWSERTGSYIMKNKPLNGGWGDDTYTCI